MRECRSERERERGRVWERNSVSFKSELDFAHGVYFLTTWFHVSLSFLIPSQLSLGYMSTDEKKSVEQVERGTNTSTTYYVSQSPPSRKRSLDGETPDSPKKKKQKIEDFLPELECPVCKIVPRKSKIFQCNNGHLLVRNSACFLLINRVSCLLSMTFFLFALCSCSQLDKVSAIKCPSKLTTTTTERATINDSLKPFSNTERCNEER